MASVNQLGRKISEIESSVTALSRNYNNGEMDSGKALEMLLKLLAKAHEIDAALSSLEAKMNAKDTVIDNIFKGHECI
jgi:hypothetical protein